MNSCNFVGNINKPELRYLPDSTPVLQFSFAANSGYGAKKATTWLNCSLFGKRAETLHPMLNSGERVGIVGELTNRKYVDKQGVEKYSLELRVSDLTLLGTKSDSNTPATQNNAPQAPQNDANDGFDDDIGF
jgi:single-strand DNA-binding protein